MIRALLVAATGMEAQKYNIDVIANNLANVNTVGYKKGRADFAELIYQDLKSPGTSSSENSILPSGIQLGLGTKIVSTQKLFQQGDFVSTGNHLDVVIEGDGFFKITMPDGTEAYTRSGSFRLDSEGRIVNSEGYLLSPEITIPSTAVSITIGGDGKVTVMEAGNTNPTEVGTIQLVRFINPGGLKPVGKNLYVVSSASGDPIEGIPGTEGIGTILQGFVEMSNVNVVEEMVNMIVSQRAYEVCSKAIQTTDEFLQIANNMKR